LKAKWHTLNFRPHFVKTTDAIEKLDVTLLQKYVLDPIFGLRISARATNKFRWRDSRAAELEKTGQLRRVCLCFFNVLTSIEDLMTIADAGGIMPPKSTWFEPKLRDGMFCHMIDVSMRQSANAGTPNQEGLRALFEIGTH